MKYETFRIDVIKLLDTIRFDITSLKTEVSNLVLKEYKNREW